MLSQLGPELRVATTTQYPLNNPFSEQHTYNDPTVSALTTGGFVVGGIFEFSDVSVSYADELARVYDTNGVGAPSKTLAHDFSFFIPDYQLAALANGSYAAIAELSSFSFFVTPSVDVSVVKTDGTVVTTQLDSGLGIGFVDLAGLTTGNAVAVWQTSTAGHR